MLKVTVIVLSFILVSILGIAARRPEIFHVQRRITLHANPEAIFPLLNDLHSWQSWSAWEKHDPAMQRSFSGPEQGLGARYTWQGNRKVGQGSMEIVESIPNMRVTVRLEFIKPFSAQQTGELTLIPREKGTEVIWDYYGPTPFLVRLIGVFVNMKKMIGKELDASLANLRKQVERPA